MNTFKAFWHQIFERWLSRRIPSRSAHQLNSRNIMIYPTRFGLSYAAFVMLIFLLGTNYQNNIILLLSYLLASLFISVMLHSFYNFSKLRFYSEAKQQGYAGDVLNFPIDIMAEKIHFDINLHFTDDTLDSPIVRIEQCQQGSQTLKLAIIPKKRGKHYLGRVTVFSEYSLGIFKSKTVLDFGHYGIVYPKPKRLVSGQYQLASQCDETSLDSYNTTDLVGTDDFSELKSFVRGESKSRTAWKQLAKGQGHYSKHYQASQSQLQWLKLSEMPGNDIETRLAYLSFLVAEMSISNQTFGLELGTDQVSKTMNIEPSSGFAHQEACLVALALYS